VFFFKVIVIEGVSWVIVIEGVSWVIVIECVPFFARQRILDSLCLSAAVLPFETQVESGTFQSKSGIFVSFSNSGFWVQGSAVREPNTKFQRFRVKVHG
jgi:hypothetical protein